MNRKPVQSNVREYLAWAYANLARAHAALDDGSQRYQVKHHMIRARLYKGLRDGSMSLGSIFEDERLKLNRVPQCAYCESVESLAVDHLMPRARGMCDRPDNLVLACRSCNSSKRDRDCIAWLRKRDEFPSLMLLRRYLKLAFDISTQNRWMDMPWRALDACSPPFDPENFPLQFPELSKLKLQ